MSQRAARPWIVPWIVPFIDQARALPMDHALSQPPQTAAGARAPVAAAPSARLGA